MAQTPIKLRTSIALNAKAVADAGFSHDESRALRVRLDLLPKLPHVNSQILNIARRSPNLLHDKAMGKHLSRMQNQEAEDVVLLGRKLHLLAVHRDHAADEVNLERPTLEKRLAALFLKAVAQSGANASDQFRYAEGLCHVIVRAKLQRLDLTALVAPARQNDDWQL